jgi:hypothetical protein
VGQLDAALAAAPARRYYPPRLLGRAAAEPAKEPAP